MSDAMIAAADRGFQFGDGVFDTMLLVGGEPLAGAPHRDRLLRHASAIGIELSLERLEAAQQAAAREVGDDPAILRTTVTRGVTARGLWPSAASEPTLLTGFARFDPAMIGAPARLVTATAPRNERSPLSRIKSLNYLDNILAAREAAEVGADDALILNTRGDVACSTIANVFALFGRRLVTPPLADGAMDGVVRGLILRAPPADYEAGEETIRPADIASADALFLTNSVRFVRPIIELDGQAFAPHPLAETLVENLLRSVAGDRDISHLLPGRRRS